MPPVSLPLNAGTGSAQAGADASIPHIATRLAAPMIRIANSLWLSDTLRRIWRHEKNGGAPGAELKPRCCRVALDPVRASRHRPNTWITPRIAHARPHHDLERLHSGGGVRPADIWPAGRGRQSAGAQFRAVWAEI